MDSIKHKSVNLGKKTIKFKIIIFVLIILIVVSTIFIIFYINTRSNPDTANLYVDSSIKVSKKIVGLENIEITSMNIKSSSRDSIIEISFKNISDTKTDNCEINLYLLDENNTIIFGTALELPDIEPNSFEIFNVLSSVNITNVSDYKVVLDKKF